MHPTAQVFIEKRGMSRLWEHMLIVLLANLLHSVPPGSALISYPRLSNGFETIVNIGCVFKCTSCYNLKVPLYVLIFNENRDALAIRVVKVIKQETNILELDELALASVWTVGICKRKAAITS